MHNGSRGVCPESQLTTWKNFRTFPVENTSELWHQGSNSENRPPPHHLVLSLGPSLRIQQGYNTILFNSWWKARSASEMQLQELLGHWEEGLHHFHSDCNSLTLLVLFPVPHTMQYSHNVMRSWHEVRSSFVRMMEILYSFVDGKKSYHKCCYWTPARNQQSEKQTGSLYKGGQELHSSS